MSGDSIWTPVDGFGKRYGNHQVLGDISLALPRRSFTVITGPSGCGKTTLLKIIAGLDNHFEGFTSNLPLQIGFAFQEPRLIPWRTLRQNIELVCHRSMDANRILTDIGLGDAADHYPSQVSLGMARRAALARAFSVKPNLLLLDEPLVSLDEANAQRIRSNLLDLWKQQRTNILMVTHNLREALQLADRIIVLGGEPTRIQSEHEIHQPQSQRNSGWLERQLRTLERQVYTDYTNQA